MLYYARCWTAYFVTAVGIESFIHRVKTRTGKAADIEAFREFEHICRLL